MRVNGGSRGFENGWVGVAWAWYRPGELLARSAPAASARSGSTGSDR